MISRLIDQILDEGRCDTGALEEALDTIMGGDATDAAIAGLLVALRTLPPDGITLAAMARVLRSHRLAVRCQVRSLVDTCGTGGDRAGTFNISTAAAFVVAACGAAVAKHGNRSVSSKTGSADVIEALGIRLDLDGDEAARLIDTCGFAFLFAPVFHPSMARVMPARRALAIRTHFNLVGPLSNPALAEHQVLGVADPSLTRVMADALAGLGCRGAVVVHCDGLDEIGLHDVTRGHRLVDGEVRSFSFDPAELGLARAPIASLAGGDAEENAGILRSILDGEDGPRADVTALNAGAALMVAGEVADMAEGFERARAALRDGTAARVLVRARESSARLASGSAS